MAIAIFTTPSKLDSMKDWSAICAAAADVESAHRELRPRLADRLRGDDPDGLAHIHRRATREIAAVALATNTVLWLRRSRRKRILTSWIPAR